MTTYGIRTRPLMWDGTTQLEFKYMTLASKKKKYVLNNWAAQIKQLQYLLSVKQCVCMCKVKALKFLLLKRVIGQCSSASDHCKQRKKKVEQDSSAEIITACFMLSHALWICFKSAGLVRPNDQMRHVEKKKTHSWTLHSLPFSSDIW